MTGNKRLASFDGVEIAYSEMGQGELTLVFVHGWSCNRRFFQQQLEHFSAAHHVLAPDLPGHGDSGFERADWCIEHFARDVAALVERAAGDKVVLIGHSMAGAVVLEAVKYCADTVQAVVLVDTHVFDYGFLDEAQIGGFLDPMGEDLETFINNLVANTLPEQRPAGLETWIRQQMYAARPEVALPAFESLLRWDAGPGLDSLDVPAVIVSGGCIDRAALARYADRARTYAIDGAGHFPQLEDAEGFNRLLQRVLAENV